MSQATAVCLNDFGLENLTVGAREISLPGPYEVLVRLTAASLNYRDLMTALGTYNPKMKLPRVLGSDAAGVVDAVGEKVTRFQPGDRVSSLFFQDWQGGEIQPSAFRSALGGDIDGVFTAARVFAEGGLIATPSYLSDAEAATLPCAALTAWHALVEDGHLAAGETVLVLGTGGVSLFALQIAKAHGARVILTSSSDPKLERGRQLGADETINYRTHPDWEVEVMKLTGKRGVDHVVEVGGAGTLPRSLKAVRLGGRVSLIGVLAGVREGVDVMPILNKSIQLGGVYVGSRAMYTRMNAAFTANQIKPVIDSVFPLAEAREAFAYLQSGSHFGKIVLSMEG